MAHLFVDTTYDVTLGLLDSKQLTWLDKCHHGGQKTSSVLQKEIFEICLRNKLKPNQLESVITMAGPGFYTGLRLSEGLSDIFKIFKVPSFSFYSYEIPSFCGFQEGVWMTKAYRGEYFFHHWNSEASENVLVTSDNVASYLSSYPEVHIHSFPALDDLATSNIKKTISTLELLDKRPEVIFSKVIKSDLHRDSFYFRAPEDEFRVST